MLRRERAVRAPAGVLKAWRHRGREDAFKRRASAAVLARERHGPAAENAYLTGFRLGKKDRERHDSRLRQRVLGDK